MTIEREHGETWNIAMEVAARIASDQDQKFVAALILRERKPMAANYVKGKEG